MEEKPMSIKTRYLKTSVNVSLSFPSWLVQICDNFCENNDLGVSELHRRAIKEYIANHRHEKAKSNIDYWEEVYQETMKESC